MSGKSYSTDAFDLQQTLSVWLSQRPSWHRLAYFHVPGTSTEPDKVFTHIRRVTINQEEYPDSLGENSPMAELVKGTEVVVVSEDEPPPILTKHLHLSERKISPVECQVTYFKWKNTIMDQLYDKHNSKMVAAPWALSQSEFWYWRFQTHSFISKLQCLLMTPRKSYSNWCHVLCKEIMQDPAR